MNIFHMTDALSAQFLAPNCGASFLARRAGLGNLYKTISGVSA